jgi:hypothetical protein
MSSYISLWQRQYGGINNNMAVGCRHAYHYGNGNMALSRQFQLWSEWLKLLIFLQTQGLSVLRGGGWRCEFIYRSQPSTFVEFTSWCKGLISGLVSLLTSGWWRRFLSIAGGVLRTSQSLRLKILLKYSACFNQYTSQTLLLKMKWHFLLLPICVYLC